MTKTERFQALYQKYYRRMVKFYTGSAFHLSEEDAMDLAQDAFVKFYEALDEYRGDAEWAYLEMIARNVGYNRIRSRSTAKRGRGLDVSLDDVSAKLEPAAPQQPDYADREAARFLLKRLRDALAELTPAQQQAVKLWADGLKYKQIASILNITLDAVRSRLRDAKRQLQERLGDDAAGIEWLGRLPEEER